MLNKYADRSCQCVISAGIKPQSFNSRSLSGRHNQFTHISPVTAMNTDGERDTAFVYAQHLGAHTLQLKMIHVDLSKCQGQSS